MRKYLLEDVSPLAQDITFRSVVAACSVRRKVSNQQKTIEWSYRTVLFHCVKLPRTRKEKEILMSTDPADADSPELVVLAVDHVSAAQALVPGLLPFCHQGAVRKFLSGD